MASTSRTERAAPSWLGQGLHAPREEAAHVGAVILTCEGGWPQTREVERNSEGGMHRVGPAARSAENRRIRGQLRGTLRSPGMCLCLCTCSGAAPASALRPTQGVRSTCPYPAQLGLPGDSGQQQPAPNWFEGSDEPTQLGEMGDEVQSQAPPLPLWYSWHPEFPCSSPRIPAADASHTMCPSSRVLALPEACLP